MPEVGRPRLCLGQLVPVVVIGVARDVVEGVGLLSEVPRSVVLIARNVVQRIRHGGPQALRIVCIARDFARCIPRREQIAVGIVNIRGEAFPSASVIVRT